MKSAYLALAAIGSTMALASTATPALAETMVVHYSDLNLASEDGQVTLQKRIDAAAKKVCGYEELRTGTRIRAADSRKCYREAKAKATTQFAAIIESKRLGG